MASQNNNNSSSPLSTILQKQVLLIPIGMSLAALLPLPYGFYDLLRLIVCFFSVLTAYDLTQRTRPNNGNLLLWAMVGLALLFNPVVPITLGERLLWAPFNIAAAAAFGLYRTRFAYV